MENDLPPVFVIIPLGNTIIWMILGYITFEMSSIRIKIESDFVEVYK